MYDAVGLNTKSSDIYTYKMLMRNGRLGNQLWQIASTIGIAEQNDGRAMFLPSWEYRPYFCVPEYYFKKINRGITTIDGGTNYLQDYNYWKDIKDHIKRFFAPADEVQDELLRRYPDFYDLEHKTGIHVRRGDYLKNPRHFPLPTEKYFNGAISKVLEEDPETQFIVFSDDPQWCRENFDGDFIFIEGIERPVELRDRRIQGEPQDYWDFFLLTQCDRHIIANSTFSLWASYLSDDEKVIYPSKWYGPALADVDWKLMIPDDEEWIEQEC